MTKRKVTNNPPGQRRRLRVLRARRLFVVARPRLATERREAEARPRLATERREDALELRLAR